MKYALLIAQVLITSFAASAQRKAAITYEFPYGIADNVKAELLKKSEKGLVLYDINCSGCHNKSAGKKQIIPDFTPAQMAKYEMRFTTPEHQSSIPETKVTQEEMDLVMTFLKYKAKNK